MGLNAITDKSTSVINHKLFLYAAKNLPALVIDCANFADPTVFILK